MPMRLPFPALFNRHRRWDQYVSASVDGELAPAETATFEAHLAGCSRCRQALHEERALKRMLAAQLPEQPAPRSFALTPGMLAGAPPAPRPASSPALAAGGQVMALARVMQLGAAAALLGFAALLVADFAAGGPGASFQAAGDAADTRMSAGAESDGAPPAATAATNGRLTEGPPALPTVAGGPQGQATGGQPGETPKAVAPDGAQAPAPGSAFEPPSARDLQATTESGEGDNALRPYQVVLAMVAVACAGAWLLARRAGGASSHA
jgi:hypothetical protein